MPNAQKYLDYKDARRTVSSEDKKALLVKLVTQARANGSTYTRAQLAQRTGLGVNRCSQLLKDLKAQDVLRVGW